MKIFGFPGNLSYIYGVRMVRAIKEIKVMKKRVIILSMLIGVITSCSIDRQEKREIKNQRRVNTVTVVDVVTGDTIQIELSTNGGVPSKAYIIK